MRTVETTVYQFDELSDRAKERARDWYRQSIGEDFSSFGAEYVLEDAARLGAIIGIDLRTRPVKLMGGGTRMEPNIYWSVGDHDEGASFSASYGYAKGSVRKLAAEAPAEWRNRETGETQTSKANAEINNIARELADVQKRNFYQVQARIEHSGRYHGMAIDVERADGKPISAQDIETVEQAMRDFASWIVDGLRAEWEYQNSDESIDESIRANEYEFTEEGERA